MPETLAHTAETLEFIGENPYLAPSYKDWYTNIVSDSIDLGALSLEQAQRTGQSHPHFIFKKNPFKNISRINSADTLIPDENVEIRIPYSDECFSTNSKRLAEAISGLKMPMKDAFADSPPLTSTNMLLEKDENSPKLLLIPNGNPFVAICIGRDHTYINNYNRISGILAHSTLSGIVGVIPKIGVVNSGGNLYFLSEFSGVDMEAMVLDYKRADLLPYLLEISGLMESIFVDNKVFFRNLSPRNLIYGSDGKVYLVDFDNVYDVTRENLDIILLMQLNRAAWFGDVALEEDISKILHTYTTEGGYIRQYKASAFERELAGSQETATVFEIIQSYAPTLLLERKGTYYGNIAYGHRLGRFISDFLREDEEIRLLKYISSSPELVDDIRGVLYIACLLDQELLLRQKYALDQDLELLTRRLLSLLESIDFKAIRQESLPVSEMYFRERYSKFLSGIVYN